MLVFVCGTLKRGGYLNGYMGGSTFLHEDTIKGTMHNMRSAYPAIRLEGDGTIHGEVWDVPNKDMVTLDMVEGVDMGLYRRAETTTITRRKKVVVYEALDWAKEFPVVPSGMW